MLGGVQVESRQILSSVQVESRQSLQVESRQSSGRVQVESRQSLGRVKVKFRQSICRVQVEPMQSQGRVQVHTGQSLGRVQVEFRKSLQAEYRPLTNLRQIFRACNLCTFNVTAICFWGLPYIRCTTVCHDYYWHKDSKSLKNSYPHFLTRQKIKDGRLYIWSYVLQLRTCDCVPHNLRISRLYCKFSKP